MPILRSLEVRIQPGRRQQWGAFMKEVKKVVDRHGSPLRVLQLQFGGHPGTALSSATADNWEQLATRTEKVAADPDYQALIARSSQLSGFPFADAAEVRLIEDITAEVGGTRAPIETSQVIEVITLRVLPGKRAKLIDIIRQIREVRTGAGLPQFNLLQTVAGAANSPQAAEIPQFGRLARPVPDHYTRVSFSQMPTYNHCPVFPPYFP